MGTLASLISPLLQRVLSLTILVSHYTQHLIIYLSATPACRTKQSSWTASVQTMALQTPSLSLKSRPPMFAKSFQLGWPPRLPNQSHQSGLRQHHPCRVSSQGGTSMPVLRRSLEA